VTGKNETVVCIVTADTHTKKAWNLVVPGFFFGGERGIRTLERVLAVTRFPVVRLRPAQPSLRVLSKNIKIYCFAPDNDLLYYTLSKKATPSRKFLFFGVLRKPLPKPPKLYYNKQDTITMGKKGTQYAENRNKKSVFRRR
jgi:hypothetical protein